MALLALAPITAPPVAAGDWNKPPPKKSNVKAPKSGSVYTAKRYDIYLQIDGKSVAIVAFTFPCGAATGRTGLNDIQLKKGTKGYKFAIKAHGSITYSDNYPDENAVVDASGRFSRDAKAVHGLFHVNSPRCGDTGNVKWNAAR